MPRIQDDQLLALLEQDGRAKAVTLAKALGVTETAVRKRIQKLQADGVIQGFTVLRNPVKSGKEVHIGIDTEPEAYLAVLQELKQNPDVKHIYTASGDHMIMTICRFPDREAAEEFIRQLEAHPKVTKVCPAFINERVK